MIYFIISLFVIVTILSLFLCLSISLSASEREETEEKVRELREQLLACYEEQDLRARARSMTTTPKTRQPEEKTARQGDEDGDVKKLVNDTFENNRKNEVQNSNKSYLN